MKYLSINVTKYVQGLHEENYKSLMKQIKKSKYMERYSIYTDRKTQHCEVLPNLIYRFNAIPSKIPPSHFVDNDKLILKFIWKGKRIRQPTQY